MKPKIRHSCRRRATTLLPPLAILCAVSFAFSLPALAQQSTTGPVPPPGIDRGLEHPKRASVVLDVPAYIWQHGCGPTAAGMVVGYWETQGFDHLVAGDDAWSQNGAVNAMIASDHGNPSCGAGYSDHYQDYSCPIDDGSGSPLPDRSQTGGAHPSSCVADFMRTSWSSAFNLYG